MIHRRLLYGVPGVGKTTCAAAWARADGVAHLELDALRITLPGAPDYTTDAWRRLGPLSERTAVDGLLSVRVGLADPVREALLGASPAGWVAEASFVDPRIASQLGAEATLLVSRDASLHRTRFWVHRTPTPAGEEQFRAARLLQMFLIEEASQLGVAVIDAALA